MCSGNYENKWGTQPFVFLLLEKFIRMLHYPFRHMNSIYLSVILKIHGYNYTFSVSEPLYR